jgi:hypothetical protein
VTSAAVNPFLSVALRMLADFVILKPAWAKLRSSGIYKYLICTHFKDLISQVGNY